MSRAEGVAAAIGIAAFRAGPAVAAAHAGADGYESGEDFRRIRLR